MGLRRCILCLDRLVWTYSKSVVRNCQPLRFIVSNPWSGGSGQGLRDFWRGEAPGYADGFLRRPSLATRRGVVISIRAPSAPALGPGPASYRAWCKQSLSEKYASLRSRHLVREPCPTSDGYLSLFTLALRRLLAALAGLGATHCAGVVSR
jgi:hypothetical protein